MLCVMRLYSTSDSVLVYSSFQHVCAVCIHKKQNVNRDYFNNGII